MKKGTFISDTFEQLTELGQSAKKSGKAAVQIVSPTKIAGRILGTEKTSEVGGNENKEKTSEVKKAHTPLDFEKLQKKYADQDKQKTEALRMRLFQMVKAGEEKILQEKKQEELEKKRKEAYEAQEKKKKEEERKKREQQAELPKGKIRRSIFTPQKVAKRQTAEVAPAAGKQ